MTFRVLRHDHEIRGSSASPNEIPKPLNESLLTTMDPRSTNLATDPFLFPTPSALGASFHTTKEPFTNLNPRSQHQRLMGRTWNTPDTIPAAVSMPAPIPRRRSYNPGPIPAYPYPYPFPDPEFDLPTSPADGHMPPNPTGCKYGGLADAGTELIAAQRALIREQCQHWQQSRRVVRNASRRAEAVGLGDGAGSGSEGDDEGGDSELEEANRPGPDPESADALNSMLRENGVIPMDQPTGLGAGWDTALSGHRSNDEESDGFGARFRRVRANEENPGEKKLRSYTWVARIKRKAREGITVMGNRVKSRGRMMRAWSVEP